MYFRDSWANSNNHQISVHSWGRKPGSPDLEDGVERASPPSKREEGFPRDDFRQSGLWIEGHPRSKEVGPRNIQNTLVSEISIGMSGGNSSPGKYSALRISRGSRSRRFVSAFCIFGYIFQLVIWLFPVPKFKQKIQNSKNVFFINLHFGNFTMTFLRRSKTRERHREHRSLPRFIVYVQKSRQNMRKVCSMIHYYFAFDWLRCPVHDIYFTRIIRNFLFLRNSAKHSEKQWLQVWCHGI